MGFFSNLMRKPEIVEQKAVDIQETPQLFTSATAGAMAPVRGSREAVLAYSQMPSLRNVVKKIAESVAAISFTAHRAMNDQGKTIRFDRFKSMSPDARTKATHEMELLEDSPIIQWLEAGNECMSGFAVKQITETNYQLLGEGAIWKQRNQFGMPVSAWPIVPHWIKDIPGPGETMFRVSISSKEMLIPASEIFFIRDHDPANPYGRGSGTALSLADELDTTEYSSAFLRSFFANGAMPDGVVMFDDRSAEEVKRIKEDWNNKHRGQDRQHQMHFLNQKAEIQQFQKSLRDMTVVELQKFLRSIVRETYGVPPEIVGLVESSNRATIEAASFIFAKWVLEARAEHWRREIQRQVVPDFDDRALIDFDSPIPSDKTHKLEVYKAKPDVITRAEWREFGGLEPNEEIDDVYLQQFGQIERPIDPSFILPQPSQQSDAAPPSDSKSYLKIAPTIKGRELRPGDIDRLLRKIDADTLRVEVVPFWKDQLTRAGQKELTRVEDATKSTRGINKMFNPNSEAIEERLRDFGGVKITNINETTRAAIQNELAIASTDGVGAKEMAGRIQDVFSKASKRRALMIARTETANASNFVITEAHRQSGVVERRRWITVQDGDRHDSAGLHGLEASINEVFTTPVGNADHPGGFGDGAQDIHCRCVTVPVFPDFKAFTKERDADEFAEENAAWAVKTERAFARGFRQQLSEVMEEFNRIFAGEL